MSKAPKLSLILAALLGLLLPCAAARATGAPTSATVISVHGKAVFHRWQSKVEHPLMAGMHLTRGTTLRTLPDGSLTIRLPDGGTMGLRPSTELTLGSLVPRYGRRSTVQLVQGLVRWAVGRLTGKQAQDLDYELYTANAVAAVKGTDFEAIVGADGSLEVRTFSTEHDGVELGDPSGLNFALAGAGQDLLRQADGTLLGRALSLADYAALAAFDGFTNPPPPKGLGDNPGPYTKVKPNPSTTGDAGRAAALALIKQSGVLKGDPKLANQLAGLVANGSLGMTGLDRLLRESQENQANAAKLKALLTAMGNLPPGVADDLSQSLRADLLASQTMGANGLGAALVTALEQATGADSVTPKQLAAAMASLGLGPGGSADLKSFLTSRQGLQLEGETVLSMDVLDALSLDPASLKALSQQAQQTEAELEAASQLSGNAALEAQEKALQELEEFSQGLAGTVLDETGVDLNTGNGGFGGVGGVGGGPGAGAPPPLPGSWQGPGPGSVIINEINDQIADLKGYQQYTGRQDQKTRSIDLYKGTAWVDRNGYQVVANSIVLRPNPETVDEIYTSSRTAGPDQGTSTFSLGYVFNQPLPFNWSGIVTMPLNAPNNIVNGAPNYYLVQKSETLLSPSGCVLCMTTTESAPVPTGAGPNSFGQSSVVSYAVGQTQLGSFAYDYLGNAVAGQPSTLQVTTQSEGANSWLFDYNKDTDGIITQMFQVQVWVMDTAGAPQSASLSNGVQGLGALTLMSPGSIDELLVTPSVGGGSIDLLMPSSVYVEAFQ
jgi:hypothetical protein